MYSKISTYYVIYVNYPPHRGEGNVFKGVCPRWDEFPACTTGHMTGGSAFGGGGSVYRGFSGGVAPRGSTYRGVLVLLKFDKNFTIPGAQ